MRSGTFAVAAIAAVLFIACRSEPGRRVDAPPVVKSVGISTISPEEALPAIEAAYSQFIDVRTPEEYAEEHAYRARNIPLDAFNQSLDKIEKNEPVYLICRTDNRSREAADILVNAGFRQAVVIKGGIEAWKAAGLPMAEPTL